MCPRSIRLPNWAMPRLPISGGPGTNALPSGSQRHSAINTNACAQSLKLSIAAADAVRASARSCTRAVGSLAGEARRVSLPAPSHDSSCTQPPTRRYNRRSIPLYQTESAPPRPPTRRRHTPWAAIGGEFLPGTAALLMPYAPTEILPYILMSTANRCDCAQALSLRKRACRGEGEAEAGRGSVWTSRVV